MRSETNIEMKNEKCNNKIKLINALKHDYALLGSTIFSVFLLILIIYSAFINDIKMLIILVSIELVFMCLWAIRFSYLASFFKNSIESKGKIIDIWFYKDRGRVTFVYQIDDMLFKRGMAIMKTKHTKSFQKGQEVDLLVNSNAHKKAIIKVLYS